MKKFLDEQFLLKTKTAQHLYHEYAAGMPIIDYHCHLPPQQIAEDTRFDNITRVWLNGDHYKWRAMRTNGVDERYITGEADDREKFRKWAETVPYTLRNPLYHWTHLELQRYFGITELLNADAADRIFDQTREMLQSPEFSVRGLLKKMNVKLVCTTDDPADTLSCHQQLKKEQYEIPVLPAFRPDQAMNLRDPGMFRSYIQKISAVSGKTVDTFAAYCDALKQRHDYFHANGCRLSDHGLEQIDHYPYTEEGLERTFARIRSGEPVSPEEDRQFRSAMLVLFAQWDHEKGWVQQFHLGALRNNNHRLLGAFGPDTGWDSIGDFPQAQALSGFLDHLDQQNRLAKTILYNVNPADNEVMATMVGNFNDGSSVGKIQWGSAWWFLDQKDGMTRQLNALSNMGLLSRFVGMLTDSRSFLSFPRHEYFRRLLCDLFGDEIENGELPDDLPWTGQVIQDICYNNARNYFNWPE